MYQLISPRTKMSSSRRYFTRSSANLNLAALESAIVNPSTNNGRITNDRITTPPLSRSNSRNSINDLNPEVNENIKNITEAMDKISELSHNEQAEDRDVNLMRYRLGWETQITDFIINTSEKIKNLEKENLIMKENVRKYELQRNTCHQRYEQFLEFREQNLNLIDKYMEGKVTTILEAVREVTHTEVTLQNAPLIRLNNQFEAWQSLQNGIIEEIKEINKFIDQDYEDIKKNKKDLQDINKKIEDLVKQNEKIPVVNFRTNDINRHRSITPGLMGSTMVVGQRPQFKQPLFKGESRERPIKFLNDLEKYIHLNAAPVITMKCCI